MKGSVSEMEGSVLRQRSLDARRQKGRARRAVPEPAGRLREGRARRDPACVPQVLGAAQRASGVPVVPGRGHRASVPLAAHGRAGDGKWLGGCRCTTPCHRILTNPIYAGAYAYGRKTRRTVIEDGRKRVVHERPDAIPRTGRC